MPDAGAHTEITEGTAEVTEDEIAHTPKDEAEDGTDGDESADQFPREYVERIRKESANYRDRVKTAEARADELAHELFTARVAATGLLADAMDLEYSADLLSDADALSTAVVELVARKPHLKARKVSGAVGQGQRGDNSGQFSLLERLKGV